MEQLKPTFVVFNGTLCFVPGATFLTKYKSTKKIIFVVLLCIFLYSMHILNNKYNKSIYYYYANQHSTMECVIPDPNPYDADVLKFYWHPKPIKCASENNLVYVDANGYVRLNRSSLSYRSEDIICYYSSVRRIEDDDVLLEGEKVIHFPAYIRSDFFRVVCRNNQSKIMYDSLLESIDHRSVKQTKAIKEESPEHLSVIIFGIDSTSRLAAERSLSKTMRYIRNELNGYVFKGHNKVGENTFPNIVPLLTGKPSYSNELPKHDFMAEFIDDVGYPFVFYDYSKEGCVTFVAEDWPEIATFNYLMKGFRIQPADHYLRPMFLAMRKVSPLLYYHDQVMMYLESKRVKLESTSALCYGSRPKHQVLIDYYKKFLKSYQGLRKFSFSWLTEISHEYESFLELADEDIMQFFKWIKEENLHKNAVLFFMSDHGIRYDPLVNTGVGRLEYRMPLFSMVLPDHIKIRYPWIHQNVMENTKRLTTPYDVHELFHHILKR